jgi:hypothetical protein
LPTALRHQESPRITSAAAADVERFLDFAEQNYRDAEPERSGLPPRLRC